MRDTGGCDVIASLPGGGSEEAEEFGEASVEGKSLDAEATTAGDDVGGPERAVDHHGLIFQLRLTRPIPQARRVGELLEAPPMRLAERLRTGVAVEGMPTGEIAMEHARGSIQVNLRPGGLSLPVPECDFDFVFHVKRGWPCGIRTRDLALIKSPLLPAELRACKFRGHVGMGTRACARGHAGKLTRGQGRQRFGWQVAASGGGWRKLRARGQVARLIRGPETREVKN